MKKMKKKVVYGQNQEQAKSNFRKNNKGFVPIKAEFAGTKHNSRVYIVTYRRKKK